MMMTMLSRGDMKLLSPIFGDCYHDDDEEMILHYDDGTGNLFNFRVIFETFPSLRNTPVARLI